MTYSKKSWSKFKKILALIICVYEITSNFYFLPHTIFVSKITYIFLIKYKNIYMYLRHKDHLFLKVYIHQKIDYRKDNSSSVSITFLISIRMKFLNTNQLYYLFLRILQHFFIKALWNLQDGLYYILVPLGKLSIIF